MRRAAIYWHALTWRVPSPGLSVVSNLHCWMARCPWQMQLGFHIPGFEGSMRRRVLWPLPNKNDRGRAVDRARGLSGRLVNSVPPWSHFGG